MRFCWLILAFASAALGASIAGQDYLPLQDSAARLGLRYKVSPDGKDATLSSKTKRVELTLNQRGSTINGARVWLNFPIGEIKGTLYLSRMDYERTLSPLLHASAFAPSRYRLRHIVIDAGHGGHDTGARNKPLRVAEKNFTLDVARRLKQRLEALGYRVSLTRNDDNFVELKDRPRLANALRADLFISIHFNASEPSITGVETYAYTPRGAPSSSRQEVVAADRVFQSGNTHDIANLWLAYDIQKSMVANLKTPDRAVRHARFAVLETLKCPGVLIEGGFISSPSECSRLSSSLYRQQLSNAIADGIRAYHRRILKM